jgi:CheY-like chemotaxis protein
VAKILVIEDDPAIRMVLETALLLDGYEVEVHKNALEGLTSMQSGMIPDLVLTDLIMSVMDGRTLIKTMRDDAQLQNIPAVIITGCIPKQEVLPEADQFQGLLIKPFDIGDLLELVAMLTRKGVAAR